MRWEWLEGVEAVRARAAAWDNLWSRSDETSPTARCEAVCLWHAHFHPKVPLRVIAVLDGNELIAVLPLSSRGWPQVGTLPSNDWVAGGTLLIDPDRDLTRVADCLLEGLTHSPFIGCVFRGVPIDRAAWRALTAASVRAGWHHVLQPLHDIGTIDLTPSWQQTETRLGGNYRRQMAKAQRRLEAAGKLEFVMRDSSVADATGSSWEAALREGWELEARGWKGREGTAIAQQPGLMAFMARHAAALAGPSRIPDHPALATGGVGDIDDAGQRVAACGVRIATLRLDGRPIAFLYCWFGKDCVFTPKIAYDESYAECSPGKLVFYWNLRDLIGDGHWRLLDMAGPLADYNAKWATGAYAATTLVLGKPGLQGRLFAAAYAARRRLRDWRKRGPTGASRGPAGNTASDQDQRAASAS